nr:aconitase family protein [bacterium]
ARDLGDVRIDQAVIGSCTNGRMDDLREAAAVLAGRKVAPGVRTLIFPGTQAIYLEALREGLLEKFVEAGCVVSPPTCGPCLGGHMGILGDGEKAIATTNRNFVGRMGHPGSEVYLSNPAVAAASAVAGRIADPREIVGKGAKS